MRHSIIISFLFLCLNSVAQTITTQTVGDVQLDYDHNSGWMLNASLKSVDGREFLTLHYSASSPMTPPRTSLSFRLPQVDIYQLWTAGNDNTHIGPDWAAFYESSLASNMPLYALLNNNDTNKLTIACDEVKRVVKMDLGVREEGADMVFKMRFFEQPEATLNTYTVTILLDNRSCFWADAVMEASNWMAQGLNCITPTEDAWKPFYSTWYNFHQDVTDKALEAECDKASALGMRTIIVDDGWQTDDNNRGYAYCGDWEVSKNRFPDFPSHIDRVHAKGMKYMLWYSVPWMGAKSKNFKRFQGKYLYFDGGLQAAALDPRFPEVRQFLINKYIKAMKDWKLDGFKLDFIDSFHFRGEDPAIKENYAGRDIQSLPEAVDVLMSDVYKALSTINPEVLIEFRQSYIGPAIRQYGNLLRAGDCPANPQDNRVRIAKLRLTSGKTAVHSDMLEWHVKEKDVNVACNIINSLFGVVQYSAMLSEVTYNHKKIIKHFIDFSDKHRNTLLHSQFIPHHPELDYPIIEAASADERIVAVYSDCAVADISAVTGKVIILNATGKENVNVKFPTKARRYTAYDCYGNRLMTNKYSSLKEVYIPVGGYIETM